jgi:hypothetical protein
VDGPALVGPAVVGPAVVAKPAAEPTKPAVVAKSVVEPARSAVVEPTKPAVVASSAVEPTKPAVVAPSAVEPSKPATKPSVVEPSRPAVASNTVAKPSVVEPSKPAVASNPVGKPSPADVTPSQRSAELAAYRVAHHAHFRGSDPAAALAAWNAYLAKFPDGQLAPEARYDRALVLIKLKRLDDARMALIPFATAPAGSYRQREAAKLLEALR